MVDPIAPAATPFFALLDAVCREPPAPADAIVWLQGDRYDRAEKVLALYVAGAAPRVVVTGNNVLTGVGPRPEEDNIDLPAMLAWLATRGVPDAAVLLDEHSLNTWEQGRNVLTLARDRGWGAVLLVGSPYYQPRAFLTFVRAARTVGFGGRIINQPAELPWERPPGGRARPARDYLSEEQEKIRRYVDHTVSIEEGLRVMVAAR